jgi:NADP-dependent 3-hydroxy acid dehydrogenase YdfG
MKKVIMISGANRGIGKAIALNLHKNGFLLSLGIRDLDTTDADILWLKKNGVLLASYRTDTPNTESE